MFLQTRNPWFSSVQCDFHIKKRKGKNSTENLHLQTAKINLTFLHIQRLSIFLLLGVNPPLKDKLCIFLDCNYEHLKASKGFPVI